MILIMPYFLPISRILFKYLTGSLNSSSVGQNSGTGSNSGSGSHG
jgi:hypothetical protein